jgi:hypothetical protein
MKRFETHPVGIDQGDFVLFADFRDGGEMWTGSGPRERSRRVTFSRPFRDVPAVHASISLWDVDTGTGFRAEVIARNVTRKGFDILFRTWDDTRITRIRAAWTAIGALPHTDDWELD